MSHDVVYCIKESARKEASIIQAYWRERGFAVQTRIESTQHPHSTGQIIWAVRSNMVNGLPFKEVK